MAQRIFLVNDEKLRVHKALRNGTRGRAGIIPFGRCQVYPMYLDRYRIMTDLFPITGGGEDLPHPYVPCAHCWSRPEYN